MEVEVVELVVELVFFCTARTLEFLDRNERQFLISLGFVYTVFLIL